MSTPHEGADLTSAPSARPDGDERAEYFRRQRRRSLLIASISTITVVGLLVILVPRAPGWDRVRTSFFNGERFREDFPELLSYLWVDVKLFLWCAPCILVWGLVIALCRNTRNPVLFPVRLFAAAYTDVFRGVPIILTIYIIGFGVPGLGLDRPWNSPYIWGPVALVLAYSAYVAEVFRAGIESIHESQRAAARSLGLRHGQTMRFVVLPQAARRVIPPLMNDFLSLQKGRRARQPHRPHRGLPPRELAQGPLRQLHPARRGGDHLPRDHDPAHPPRRLVHPPAAAPHRRIGHDMTGGPKLAIERVRKSFGTKVVLDDVSLTVDDHEVVCLIGASGSGKSTLLRCVNLLEPIDRGAILLDGTDISRPGLDPDPIRARIGMVFQSYNLFPHMSVLANITLAPRRVRSVGRRDAETQAMQLLERFGLADKSAAYPDQLSGGQQQRVAIVRALAMQPEIMLLDEITAALDPVLVGEVLEVVREMRGTGMTMVLATHEMGFAREIADTVCFLDGGRILEQGPPEQIFTAPREQATRDFLARVIASGRL
jgi:polar amino acid transport system ATP-binding protein